MRRNIIVFAVLLSLCLSACTSKEKAEKAEEGAALTGVGFEKLSLQDALVKAKDLGKLVLVDFFSPT